MLFNIINFTLIVVELGGILNERELKQLVDTNKVETIIVASTDMQGRLCAKRLTAWHFLENKTGVGTCSVILGWGQDHSEDYGYNFTGWDLGYPDLIVKPDLKTVRWYPWFEKTLLMFGDQVGVNEEIVNVSPRTILKKMISQLNEHGLNPYFVSEIECYLLKETPTSAFDKGFVNLETKHRTMHPETLSRISEDEEFLGPLRHNLELAGVPVESVKAEYAPGQIEINLSYTDALAAADRHVLFKTGTKEEALKQNLIATFMAKPWHELGGSSCHIHLSLFDSNGKNVFFDKNNQNSTSELMKYFLGGLIHYTNDVFLFFAPTINSYKRMVPNTFAPSSVTWGGDNRTVAFRLVGNEKSRRIENRIPGADINPYLAYSAMIAAGLKGIKDKIKINDKPETGNAYAKKVNKYLPQSLQEATMIFKESEFIKEYFGDEVQKHYSNFGEQTVLASKNIVTDFERRILLLDI